MRRHSWLKTTAFLTLLVVAAVGLGWAASGIYRPSVRESARLSGWVTVVQLRPIVEGGCQRPDQVAQAINTYSLERQAKRALVSWLRPGPALASAGTCRVLADRQARNLIVDAGEAFLVDAWQNLVELEIMRNHGIGTGTTAAAETQTALVTELTTQYNPDNTRATGSLTEASASVFRTVGTNTVDATAAVTEWGLFSSATSGAGTMWSRVVFTVINLASGDSIQSTYDLTIE